MDDETERRNAITDISRGERAEKFIADPLHIEAITAMNAAMYVEFQETKLADEDARHELWQRMQLMKQHVAKYESIIKQGNKAKTTLSLLDKSLAAIGIR